jgi:predicted secreted protein
MTSLGGISDAALFFGRWGIVAAVVLGLGARTLVEEEYLFKPKKSRGAQKDAAARSPLRRPGAR